MNKLTKTQILKIVRDSMGWGDAKRKLCAALGVEYKWDYELPDYVMQVIKERVWK